MTAARRLRTKSMTVTSGRRAVWELKAERVGEWGGSQTLHGGESWSLGTRLVTRPRGVSRGCEETAEGRWCP